MFGAVVRLAALVCALAILCGCSSGEHVVTLRDWELVTPDGTHQSLHLPARVDRWLPRAPAEYRLRAHVDLPPELRGRRLTLAFAFLHARAVLRAGDQEMVALVPEMRQGFRGTDQPRWRIPEELTRSGAVDLELIVTYRHVMSAWLDVAPRLSDTSDGDAAYRAVDEIDHQQATACMATVLLMSLLYGIVFLLDRRRAAHGWLALQGIFGGAGYAIAYVGVLSQSMFGPYENCFVPVFLCIGVAASVEFTNAQFDLGRPSRLWWAGVAGCALLSAAVPSPFVGPRLAPLYSCVMTLANVAYQAPVAARIWRERRSLAALVILASWVGLGALGLPDLVAWSGGGEIAHGLRGACAGLGLVALMQAMVLSVQHQATLARADVLNVELSSRLDALSARNAEVLRLNDELRRQIGARADALAMALAQASAPRNSGPRVLEPGEIVAKRYRVERAVGEGATGKVYEVTRLGDGERLALKLLDPSSDATEMARFAREAQIISQIDHPNVVRIADVDLTNEGFFYLIVEFVEGLSLRHHYGRPRSLLWNVSVLAQVAEGLSVIHARGIVHRDLKPGNVLVTSSPDHDARPMVKIADFGISSTGNENEDAMPSTIPPPGPPSSITLEALAAPAEDTSDGSLRTGPSRSVTQTDSLLTQTGAWLGTPKYMAPELGGAAKHARPTSDIFAFGVMAHELLAGGAPFEESPAITRVKGERFVKPSPIRAKGGVLDPAVGALLDLCLAESPAERPESKELAEALTAYVTRLDRDVHSVSGERTRA